MKKRSAFEIIKYIITILAGNLLFAFSVYTLVSPTGIVAGGFTGLGLFVERVFGIPTEYFVLPANLLVLILGWIILGKKTALASLASSILYPVFLGILRYIPGLTGFTDNVLLAAVIGGAGVGASIGMLMRVGASTGGSDIICMILGKWTHIPVSVFILVTDVVIIAGQIFFSGIEMILYGVLYTAVMSFVLDKVMLFGQSQIQVIVISDEYEKMRSVILSELNFGVTMLHVQTGCIEKEQLGIMCVVHPRQLYSLQKRILEIDPDAFITVTQIKEVNGRGFTSERRNLSPVSSARSGNDRKSL